MEKNSTATNRVSMDRIMNASFNEVTNNLTVSFRKTVLTKQYESEVIETTNSVQLDRTLTGIERMFIAGTMQAQLQYQTYVMLVDKGLLTKTDLNNSKLALEEDIYNLKYKADQMLGSDFTNNCLGNINLDK
jgi:hypothetical protein